MTHDNIISKVTRVEVIQGQKNGNTWHALVIHFINGYKQRTFLDDAQTFAVKDAISSAASTSDSLVGGLPQVEQQDNINKIEL